MDRFFQFSQKSVCGHIFGFLEFPDKVSLLELCNTANVALQIQDFWACLHSFVNENVRSWTLFRNEDNFSPHSPPISLFPRCSVSRGFHNPLVRVNPIFCNCDYMRSFISFNLLRIWPFFHLEVCCPFDPFSRSPSILAFSPFQKLPILGFSLQLPILLEV